MNQQKQAELVIFAKQAFDYLGGHGVSSFAIEEGAENGVGVNLDVTFITQKELHTLEKIKEQFPVDNVIILSDEPGFQIHLLSEKLDGPTLTPERICDIIRTPYKEGEEITAKKRQAFVMAMQGQKYHDMSVVDMFNEACMELMASMDYERRQIEFHSK